MPLERHEIDLGFVGGEDGGIASKLAEPPLLGESTNVYVHKDGEIRKRPPFRSFASTQSEDRGMILSDLGAFSSVAVASGIRRYSEDGHTSPLNDNRVGWSHLSCSSRQIISHDQSIHFQDTAVIVNSEGDRYVCMTWTQNVSPYQAYVAVVEEDTGVFVIPPTQVGLYRFARVVVAANQYFVIIGEDQQTPTTTSTYIHTSTLSRYYIDTTAEPLAISSVASVGLANDPTVGRWDICDVDDGVGSAGGLIFLIQGYQAGATPPSTIKVHRLTFSAGTLAITHSATLDTTADGTNNAAEQDTGLAVYADPNSVVWTGWCRTGHAIYMARNSTTSLGALTAATLIYTASGSPYLRVMTITQDVVNGVYNGALVAASDTVGPDALDSYGETTIASVTSGLALTGTRFANGWSVAGKAFTSRNTGSWPMVCLVPAGTARYLIYRDRAHCYALVAVRASGSSSTQFITPKAVFQMDREYAIRGARTPTTGGQYYHSHCHLPKFCRYTPKTVTPEYDGELWAGAFQVRIADSQHAEQSDTEDRTLLPRAGLALTRLNMFPRRPDYQFIDGTCYFDGGIFGCYDGLRSAESCPIIYPQVDNSIQNAVGSAWTVDDYTVVVTYSWEDANNVLHRGAPSNSYTISVGTARTSISIEFTARPPSGVSSLGSALSQLHASTYRATDNNPYQLGSTDTPVAGSLSPYERIVDATTNTNTLTNPRLYTEGGILPSYCPPPLVGLVAHERRLFAINGDNQAEIRFTKPLESLLAPEWNPQLGMRVAGDSAAFTALASLDDKLICFKRSKAWFLAGEGPNAAGQGQFIGPLPIAGAYGCVNRHSVVSGTFGVIFEAERGLCLLGRDLSYTPLRQADNHLEDFPVILDAVDFAAMGCVIFATVPGTTTATRRATLLVWDYVHNVWHTWKLPSVTQPGDWSPGESGGSVTPSYNDDVIALDVHDDKLYALVSTWATNGGTRGDTYFLRLTAHAEASTDFAVGGGLSYAAVEPASITTGWIRLGQISKHARIWRALIHGTTLETVDDSIPPVTTIESFRVAVQYKFDEDTAWAEVTEYTPTASEIAADYRPGVQQVNAIRFRIDEDPEAIYGKWHRFQGMTLELGVNPGAFPRNTV